MRYTAAFTGLLAVSGAGAMSTSINSHVQGEVVESLNGVPEGWNEVGSPSPDHKLFFRIAVPSENRHLFERTLMEVSTPSNPKYGKHLKRDELKDLIKPRAESVATVMDWLEQSGVEARDIQNKGEWINFFAPVKRAEAMMGTTFKTYQSEARSNVKKIRSLGYSVPGHVRPSIDMIQPTTRFGQIRAEGSMILSKEEVPFSVLAVNATCNTKITPTCLADLYNFKDYNASAAETKLGVTGYLEQYARFGDLEKFLSTFAPDKAGTSFDVEAINNGPFDQNSTADSVEANLDIQYTVGLMSPKIKTIFYTTPGRGELVPDLDAPDPTDIQNEPYLDLFTYLMDLDDDELPQVLSTSYGENEQSVPTTYAKKVCDMIGQLGARGVSVIFSSGDSGTGSACQSNDGKNTTRFSPIFPAACPYVTSVGGTAGVAPEKAVSFSSGGFSDLWPRPAYQEKAVGDYLKILGNRWEGLYNPNGRGFPDVAAQGLGFQVFDSGHVSSIGGTSASAPVFAAVVAMLNNARMGAGMPALGFLNPWIYEQGFKGMKDVVDGGSRGCTGRSMYSGQKTPVVPFASWNATKGWDPVTGYGTPDFEQLRRLSTMPQYGKRRIRRSLLGDM